VSALVFLVRHAEAAPGGVDADRRLTAAGKAAFAELVSALGPRLAVKRVLTSPFLRARQTAEVLARWSGVPVEVHDELASGHDGGRELLALARAQADGTALVGHNPEIAEALELAGGRSPAVPPGTVAALDVAGKVPRLLWLRSP
jgi:phosphohistidine phosphatase